MGFEELCVDKLKVSNESIIPSRLNSDVIENLLCQQKNFTLWGKYQSNLLGILSLSKLSYHWTNINIKKI